MFNVMRLYALPHYVLIKTDVTIINYVLGVNSINDLLFEASLRQYLLLNM